MRRNRFPFRVYLRSGIIIVAALLTFIPIYMHWENQVTVMSNQIPETQTEGSAIADSSADTENASTEPAATETAVTETASTEFTPAKTDTTELSPTETDITEPALYDFSQPVPLSEPVDISFFDDAVIIGNSRAEGLILFNELADTTAFTHKGLTVSSAFTMPLVDTEDGEKISAVDALRQTEFSKVYLMFGVNETGWWSVDIFIQKYQKLIDEVKSINPEADLYVHSIFPVSAGVDSTHEYLRNGKIRTYNERIAAMAEENGLYFVNAAEMFAQWGEPLPEDASTDGIHLKMVYCKKWMEYLLSHTV